MDAGGGLRQQTSKWQRPLLGNCFDNSYLCVFAFCTPCAEFGRNAQRLHHMQNKDCLVYGCLYLVPGLCCYLTAVLRSEIRELRAIPGSRPRDFLTHLACPCCAIIQESEELDDLEYQISRQQHDQTTSPYVICTQPQPPPDALPPATEETPYDPTDDLELERNEMQPDAPRY